MKFVSNAGQARVIDLLRPWLRSHCLGVVSRTYSVFAFAEIQGGAGKRLHMHLIRPPATANLALLRSTEDSAARNRRRLRRPARQFTERTIDNLMVATKILAFKHNRAWHFSRAAIDGSNKQSSSAQVYGAKAGF